MTDLIIVDDEAWLPEEWDHRRWQRGRYQRNPKRREQVKAAVKRWRQRNPHKVREYDHRPRLVGSLHELACTGPSKRTGCVCHKVRCYDRPRG